jgi:hypothetical protein
MSFSHPQKRRKNKKRAAKRKKHFPSVNGLRWRRRRKGKEKRTEKWNLSIIFILIHSCCVIHSRISSKLKAAQKIFI